MNMLGANDFACDRDIARAMTFQICRITRPIAFQANDTETESVLVKPFGFLADGAICFYAWHTFHLL